MYELLHGEGLFVLIQFQVKMVVDSRFRKHWSRLNKIRLDQFQSVRNKFRTNQISLGLCATNIGYRISFGQSVIYCDKTRLVWDRLKSIYIILNYSATFRNSFARDQISFELFGIHLDETKLVQDQSATRLSKTKLVRDYVGSHISTAWVALLYNILLSFLLSTPNLPKIKLAHDVEVAVRFAIEGNWHCLAVGQLLNQRAPALKATNRFLR